MKILRKFGFSEWVCVAAMLIAVAIWIHDMLPADQGRVYEVVMLASSNEAAMEAVDCFLGQHPHPSRGELRSLRSQVVMASAKAKTPRSNAQDRALEAERERLDRMPMTELSPADWLRWILIKMADHASILIAAGALGIAAAVRAYRRRRAARRTIFL